MSQQNLFESFESSKSYTHLASLIQFCEDNFCCAKLPENICKTVSTRLESFKFNQTEWNSLVQFNSDRYLRILLAEGLNYSIVMNCWSPGQKTPIHTHKESSSWFKVLEGELTYVGYNTKKQPVLQRKLAKGSILSCDLSLHSLQNNSGNSAVTLHIYSPPYKTCTDDEVHIPAVYCYLLKGLQKKKHDLLAEQLVREQTIFSNFGTLTEILKKKFETGKKDINGVRLILDNFQLNPKEWEQYASWDSARYTRNLIAYDENFTLILLCWDKNQKSPIHDHAGSCCWVKVLQGELTEELYDYPPSTENRAPALISKTTLLPGFVAYIDDSIGIHRMGNSSESSGCVTLHLYAPPYHQCHIFEEGVKASEKKVASMACVNQLMLEESLQASISHVQDEPTLLTGIQSLVNALNVQFTQNQNPEPTKLEEIVKKFTFLEDEWRLYSHFSPHKYTRNLLYYNEKFSLFMICWNHNQFTPIHEHDKQTQALAHIISGNLIERQIDPKSEKVMKKMYMPHNTTHIVRTVAGPHQIGNESSTETAVSLHLYWPPYFECSSGTISVPCVYCSSIQKCRQTESRLSERIELEFQKTVFSNFQSFVEIVGDYLNSKDDLSQIVHLLRKFNFHPREWEGFCIINSKRFTRNLVAYGEKFTLTLLVWQPGHETPIHNHNNSRTWLKILSGGPLQDTHYKLQNNKPVLHSVADLLLDSAECNEEDVVHKLKNIGSENCVALHLSYPPYHTFTCWDDKLNTYEAAAEKVLTSAEALLNKN